jgi:23S rRNA G2069 N7-methylase RlmK/C1962 C5-methylase RlmI
VSEREENEGMEGVIDIRENGVLFRMDLRSGQKTGHYCDQRDNRSNAAFFTQAIDFTSIRPEVERLS